MQPKTEELLNYLAWQPEASELPASRRLEDSFEQWAYGRGFWRQVRTLELQGWLERGPVVEARVGLRGQRPATYPTGRFRLTAAGRRHALGGAGSRGVLVTELGRFLASHPV